MPRNMSFMLTTEQFKAQTKTVTRRLGWRFLKVGDIVNGCEKVQGLKRGEKIVKLGRIRIVSTRWEELCWMTRVEVELEGFPGMQKWEFIRFFCEHNKCTPSTMVNRIEFEYVQPRATGDAKG